MKEIWKPIPRFETYQVSSLGRVRNKLGYILKGFKLGPPNSKRWAVHLMSPYNLEDGWEKRQKTLYIHRAVLMAFIGMPPINYEGCHKNDDPDNNSLDNLYWGTRKQNTEDRIRNRKHCFPKVKYGADNENYKHSDEIIKQIRSEYTDTKGDQTKLAKKYGIARQYISSIVRNKVRPERMAA